MKQENKICEHCGQNFTISEDELSLYKKVGIELPTLCFFCRAKLHFSFWMFGKFRKGKSDLSGESLITVLPEKNRYPIYTLHEWHSDKWNALDYGADYNPDIPFFKQLQDLQEKVPKPHQNGTKNTKCDWCDDVCNSKNSRDCIDSYFLYDCRNCQNCFMCWNLRNKRFCIENIQYSQKDYEEKLRSFKLGSHMSIQAFKKRFEELTQEETVHRQNFNFKTYNSAGDYLINTKDCHNCHTLSDSEDCYNCVREI